VSRVEREKEVRPCEFQTEGERACDKVRDSKEERGCENGLGRTGVGGGREGGLRDKEEGGRRSEWENEEKRKAG
jgi:hypothetical protein